jgi:hypothetical protein
MKLIGYIRPYGICSFTIPVYGQDSNYYVHKLNKNLIIEQFDIYPFDSKDIILLNDTLNFEIGDCGCVIYISSDYTPIIANADKITKQILKQEKNIYLNPGLLSEINNIENARRN